MDPSINISNEFESTTQASSSVGDQAGLADQTNQLEVTTKDLSGIDLDAYKAAKKGDMDALMKYTNLDQILTATNNTVLHIYIACTRSPTLTPSQEEALKKMLEICPALLLQQNQSGDTALHIAARYGRAHIANVLIEAAKARHDEDPENGVFLDLQMLIRKTNNNKDTALHEAVRFNHQAVVSILTKEYPEFLYPANVAGETPLYMAAERGYGVLFSQILRTCTYPAYQGPAGLTALHAAVIYNDKGMTKELLEITKTDLTKATDDEGCTPLHKAAFYGHTSIVKQLLQYDKSAAYIRTKQHKETPLHFAVSRGHLEVTKELISQCPDCCELVDYRGRNVLHCAIENNRHEIEKFIRKDPWLSNVLLNGKDAESNTPLHHIFANPDYNGRDFIWDTRVDTMAFNKKNLTALDILSVHTPLLLKVWPLITCMLVVSELE